MRFDELPVGDTFIYEGKRYTKTGTDSELGFVPNAEDENGELFCFVADMIVEIDDGRILVDDIL